MFAKILSVIFQSCIFRSCIFSRPITHTHTRLTALCPGLPRWASTRKVTPIWILLKQETVSGSSVSWAICKCAPRSRQITTPAPHYSVFYRPDALPAAQPTVSKHWRHKSMPQKVTLNWQCRKVSRPCRVYETVWCPSVCLSVCPSMGPQQQTCSPGPLHIGANGVSWHPWKNGWKIKKRKHAKKSSFLCLCYILRATRAGRCRERRYADHVFIPMYFRMHRFIVKFLKFSSPRRQGALTPLTRILQTFLPSAWGLPLWAARAWHIS